MNEGAQKLSPHATNGGNHFGGASNPRLVGPSPPNVAVHQDLYPGSRSVSILANHYYWIQRCAKDEAMKLK